MKAQPKNSIVRFGKVIAKLSGCGLFVIYLCGVACDGNPPTTTSVGLSVATLVKTSGLVDTQNNCNPAVPAAPDVQAWWNALPPINRTFPFVGFETWRNTTDSCLESRLDVYRALVTFNMTSVANLKGLVTKAELIISTRALPAGVVPANPSCIAFTGGAGSLVLVGPAAAGTLPTVTGAGSLDTLQPNEAFPSGQTVFSFPNPWTAGSVTSTTTTTASGTGGAVFTVLVTGVVNAALDRGDAGMSWMLTSAFEGPLAGPVASPLDCKTSYKFDLQITHY